QRGRAAEIDVARIERLPVRRNPVVGGIARDARAGAEAADHFAIAPGPAAEAIAGDRKDAGAVARQAARRPDSRFLIDGRPAGRLPRIVHRNRDYPAVVRAAIAGVAA